jgi:hypothetical protein
VAKTQLRGPRDWECRCAYLKPGETVTDVIHRESVNGWAPYGLTTGKLDKGVMLRREKPGKETKDAT